MKPVAAWFLIAILSFSFHTILAQKPGDPADTADATRDAQLKTRARLKERAGVELEQRNVQAAIAAAEAVLAIERRLFGNVSAEVVETLEWMASASERAGDRSAAEGRRQEALSVLTSLHGSADWRVTDARLRLARMRQSASLSATERQQVALALQNANRAAQLGAKGETREGIPLAEQALETFRRVLGQDDLFTVTGMNLLASLFVTQGDSVKAAASRGAWAPGRMPGTGYYVTPLDDNAASQRDYARAQSLREGALTIQRRLLGDEHPATAVSLMDLGHAFVRQGDYVRAEPRFQEAVHIRRRVLGREHPDTARALHYVAKAYGTRGDYAAAEDVAKEIVAIHRKAFGEMHREVAFSLAHLASLYLIRDQFGLAEPLVQESLKISRQVLGPTNDLTIATVLLLAGLYREQGDYARAEPVYQELLATRRAMSGDAHPETAFASLELAALHRAMRRDRIQVEPLYQHALSVYRRTYGEDSPTTATVLSALGSYYGSLGDFARAEPLELQALAARRKALGERDPATAYSLNSLAGLYSSRGDFARAEPLYQEGLTILRQVYGESDRRTVVGLSNLGAIYAARGDSARAELLYQQSISILRRFVDVASVGQSERQQISTAQSLRHRLDRYVSLATTTPPLAAKAWANTVAWKGAVLARQRAYRAMAEHQELRPVFAKLQTTASRLATLVFAQSGSHQTEPWVREVADLSMRKEEFEAELARVSAEVRRLVPAPTADDIRRALPPDTVLIDMLEYGHTTRILDEERRLVAFVIPARGEVQLVSLGPLAPVAKAVAQWRSTHGGGSGAEEAGQRLRRLVWAPVEAAFEGRRPAQVLVSPDGVLGQVAFGALPGRAPGTYLLEDWAIATIPSPQVLPELLRDVPDRPADRRLLVLGDVNYDRGERVAASGASGRGERAPRDGASRFALLDGTREEITTLEGLYRQAFGATGVQALIGSQATKAALQREAPRHRFLHLATHGFFAAERFKSAFDRTQAPALDDLAFEQTRLVVGYHPGLLSGLALAGANAPTADDDGILTAEEVATLDLIGVDLAVLSACETGLGQMAGGEGLLGLQRAFHTAGVRTVVASLWKVDDAATRDIMVRFYDNLWNKHMGKLAALREAQLWMLRGLERPESTRQGGSAPSGDVRSLVPVPGTGAGRRLPYYWAAFVLSGDWR